ncbi:hypothetical protein QFZ54_002605 [Sphingomonas faeni]|nr:hypothetical protein [Sphingomonas faeni]
MFGLVRRRTAEVARYREDVANLARLTFNAVT